jgi:acyl carrier protein
MTNEQILNALEDALDVTQNSLTMDTVLSDIDEYDSMAKLSVIILADDDFGKKLTGERIRAFSSVGDIVNFLAS